MRRSAALARIAAAPLALAGCAGPTATKIVATSGSPLHPTAFGSQLYPSDDVEKTLALLAGCGSRLVRVTAINSGFDYFDTLFAATARYGMRVIVISEYAPQPVDLAAYQADTVRFHRRYAAYDPIWELWNEPNLATYWGAQPNVDDYAKLAIATAAALKRAGAREVLSGGTSGVDLNWIYGLRVRGVFDAVTGCAVHSYKNPANALNEYIQAISLLPAHLPIYTTEACVVTAGGQPTFFQDMWYLHRYLGLPALVWCEFRDGTAGPQPPYDQPMGLVTSDYTPKAVYFRAQYLVRTTR